MTYQPSKLGLVPFTYRDAQGSVDYWGVLTVEFGQEEQQSSLGAILNVKQTGLGSVGLQAQAIKTHLVN